MIRHELNSFTSLSKSERTLHWFSQHPEIKLACIHCQKPLTLNGKHLTCRQGHQFDAAKQGYFFLAAKSIATKYDEQLFEARRHIIRDSFLYERLHSRLTEIINQFASKPSRKLTILDAGSGEGSHLYTLQQLASHSHACVGIDLSKSGVQLATDYNGHLLSVVGDLTQLPFSDRQFDLILSILSPANYDEFDRLLTPDGLVVKIVPNEDYLGEIRQTMIEKGYIKNQPYRNDEVIQSFEKRYKNSQLERIKETVTVTPVQMEQLLRMTPLTWQLSEQQRSDLLSEIKATTDLTITLDVTLLVSHAL